VLTPEVYVSVKVRGAAEEVFQQFLLKRAAFAPFRSSDRHGRRGGEDCKDEYSSKCSPLHSNAVVAGCRRQAIITGPLSLGRGSDVIQYKAQASRRPSSMKRFICKCIAPISTECFWLRNLANLNSSSGKRWCELISCLNTSRGHNAATREPSH